MMAPDPQLARSDVLRIFDHYQIYLCLGAAITTVGMIAGALWALRRRRDPLLLWFSLFALLYGVRLILGYQLLWALGLRPPVFQRIVIALGFLLPIPGFFFFREMNLVKRTGSVVLAVFVPIEIGIAIATFFTGPWLALRIVNNVAVLIALAVLVYELLRERNSSADATLLRRCLFLFIACAVFDNVTGIFSISHNIEPFSFVILLAALGIVAARRTLEREQQLSVIQKELEIARKIQLSILPVAFPQSGSFRVAARYLPMTSVAGDFYDFLPAEMHEAGLLIADVSGHGVPAALIASMVKLAATSQRANLSDPAALLDGMNNALCGNTQSQFVTAGYVYLNAATRQLRYSAAAHPPMLLLRRGEVMELVENGLMLAAFDFATYSALTLPLEPGDRLVLYTDGLLEAANAQEEEFGRERLHAALRRTVSLAHDQAADCILSAVQVWSASQNDDLTILVCDFVA